MEAKISLPLSYNAGPCTEPDSFNLHLYIPFFKNNFYKKFSLLHEGLQVSDYNFECISDYFKAFCVLHPSYSE